MVSNDAGPLMSRAAALVAHAVPIPLTTIRSGVPQERTRWIRTTLPSPRTRDGAVAGIPLVILAIGTPIALVVGLLLWIAGPV
jgi:hypothetical protein